MLVGPGELVTLSSEQALLRAGSSLTRAYLLNQHCDMMPPSLCQHLCHHHLRLKHCCALVLNLLIRCIRNRGVGVGARLAMSGPLTAGSPCSPSTSEVSSHAVSMSWRR